MRGALAATAAGWDLRGVLVRAHGAGSTQEAGDRKPGGGAVLGGRTPRPPASRNAHRHDQTPLRRRPRTGGEAVSCLFASEPAINGRFGYGWSTESVCVALPSRSALRALPERGNVTTRFEAVDQARHGAIVRAVYAASCLQRLGHTLRPAPHLDRQRGPVAAGRRCAGDNLRAHDPLGRPGTGRPGAGLRISRRYDAGRPRRCRPGSRADAGSAGGLLDRVALRGPTGNPVHVLAATCVECRPGLQLFLL